MRAIASNAGHDVQLLGAAAGSAALLCDACTRAPALRWRTPSSRRRRLLSLSATDEPLGPGADLLGERLQRVSVRLATATILRRPPTPVEEEREQAGRSPAGSDARSARAVGVDGDDLVADHARRTIGPAAQLRAPARTARRRRDRARRPARQLLGVRHVLELRRRERLDARRRAWRSAARRPSSESRLTSPGLGIAEPCVIDGRAARARWLTCSAPTGCSTSGRPRRRACAATRAG